MTVDAVGRAAGARLLEQTGVLGADILAEVFELDLPVGMRLGPFLPGRAVDRPDRLDRSIRRLVGVQPHGERVRRVGLADLIGRDQFLRLGADGERGQNPRRKQDASKWASDSSPP